jgi:hypothetical protein
MYKGIRKKKKENLQEVKLTQTNVKISPSQQLTTGNRSTMVRGVCVCDEGVEVKK